MKKGAEKQPSSSGEPIRHKLHEYTGSRKQAPATRKMQNPRRSSGAFVPRTGIEPAHCCQYQILSLARLPIPPSGRSDRAAILRNRAGFPKCELKRIECQL